MLSSAVLRGKEILPPGSEVARLDSAGRGTAWAHPIALAVKRQWRPQKLRPQRREDSLVGLTRRAKCPSPV